MTDMAHFANMKAEKSHKIWVEMNDGAFVIAMTIAVWTMIFNLAVNFSGIESTEGYSILMSCLGYIIAWVLQLTGEIAPSTASIIIVGCSIVQSRAYLMKLTDVVIERF
jgi:hypothetical protein